MMTVQKTLLEDPREIAGSRSSNRFDFQKNWAICKLLDLHEHKQDYLLILDLHEDIVILDSSQEPKLADFYQVKTTEKNKWKINQLIKRTKGKKGELPSKLGKLYSNKLKFKENTSSLNFVSNGHYDVDLIEGKSAKKNKICISEIKDKDSLINSLHEELGLKKEEIDHQIIFLEFTDLSIHSHTDATKGKLSDFIEKKLKKSGYKLGIVYTTIYDEIKKKTNQEILCNEFDDLVKYKALSKSNFNEILNIILSSFDEDIWSEVNQNLMNDGYSLSERKKIKDDWQKYTVERMDRTNLVLDKVRKTIISILQKIKNESLDNCKELLRKALELYEKEEVSEQKIYQDSYLKSIILMEYFSNDSK